VLFAEPRGGIFRLTQSVLDGPVHPGLLINVIASTLGTSVIGLFAWQSRARWRHWSFDRDDRLVLLFAMMVAANAVISYPYTKDVVMSPAGAFYAAAAYAALRRVTWPTTGSAVIAVSVAALVLASCWSVRAVGVHLNLRESAFKVRTDWAFADQWFARQADGAGRAQRPLKGVLQRDAVYEHPVPPDLWFAHWRMFDID
jgi:hypothetical protein